jgi:hypothetical protein
MRIRQLTSATTVAAAALLLTACGGSPLDGKTGPQVADAAADALEKAGAVRVAGDIEQSGAKGSVDLHLQGNDVTGTITMSGAELQLLIVDGTVYVQGTPDFWTSSGLPEEAAAMFDGRWVVVPDEGASQFEEFSLAGIVDSLRNPESNVKKKVTSDEVDGKDVVVVEQENGSTLSVADDEPAYPLSLTRDGDSAGTLIFSRFGDKEDITAPDDAMDLSELAGGS